MKPLPFSLPALLCQEGEEAPDDAPPIHRPAVALFPLSDDVETPVEEWIACYRKQIGDATGLVLADCGMTVPQQRAALLACRESPGQPSFVASLALDDEGETFDGWQGNAALILLQSMGCAGVLFAPQDSLAAAEMPRLYRGLWEDARIPTGVILTEPTGGEAELLSRASLLMAASLPQARQVRQLGLETGWFQQAPTICPPPEDDDFIAVSNGHSFLLDATFDIDGELLCSGSFAEDLLELESDGCTALRLLVPDEDALESLALEQYMVKMPVSIGAPDGELMEKALRCFCGRAMADGTYEIAEQELRPLVERYGLIVL